MEFFHHKRQCPASAGTTRREEYPAAAKEINAIANAFAFRYLPGGRNTVRCTGIEVFGGCLSAVRTCHTADKYAGDRRTKQP